MPARAGSSANRKAGLGPVFAPEHWIWAAALLLIVAGFSFRSIDRQLLTADEFYSMNHAGWLGGADYSPLDVMASIQAHSPQHTPAYFLLLNLWGALTLEDVAIGRLLSLWLGLMSLAMAYRLGRDMLGQAAGILTMLIAAGSAFYNLHFPMLRMYTLLIFVAGAALWLYWRMLHRVGRIKARDALALGLAIFTLAMTHAFSALFLAALGIYHLVFARKDRRWLQVSAVVAAGILAFAPYIPVLLSAIEGAVRPPMSGSAESESALAAWLAVMLNGQPLLLLLIFPGIILGMRRERLEYTSLLWLVVIYALLLAALTPFSDVFVWYRARYHLASWLPAALFMAAGIYGWYRWRRWLGLLVLLWLLAGLRFQDQGVARYAHEREPLPPMPPAHALSRLASHAALKPALIGLGYDTQVLDWKTRIHYSQRDHFFGARDLALAFYDDAAAAADHARGQSLSQPAIWLFYPEGSIDERAIDGLQAAMAQLNYRRCGQLGAGWETVILQYSWASLDCQSPRILARDKAGDLDYRFYGAALDRAGDSLYFVDQWRAGETFNRADYNMSWQLLNAAGDKVAQLDLPLLNEGEWRRFSLDLAGIDPGSYRLVAILYQRQTSQRALWSGPSAGVGDMLPLTELALPQR